MGLLDLFLPAQAQPQGDPNNPVNLPTNTGAPGLDLLNQNRNYASSQQAAQSKQDIVKDAVAKYQAGDMKGAFAAIGVLDPSQLSKDVSGLANAGPIEQGKKTGELQADSAFGSTPAQITDLQNKGQLATAQAKQAASNWAVRKDPQSPTGFSRANKQTNEVQYINMSGDPIGAPAQAGDQPKLRPNQDVNSKGEITTISPYQQGIIKDTRKTFDTDTKDIVKAIDSAHKSLAYLAADIPGTKILETLTTLKAALGSSKINQQEVQAYGKGMGLIQSLDQAITEAQGQKAFSPAIKQNFVRMAQVASDILSKDYDQHLQNLVERTPEVDSLILKKRLVGSGPTVYQSLLKKVNALPPDLQAAYNEAHDALVSSDPAKKAKAQAAMKIFSEKFGINP